MFNVKTMTPVPRPSFRVVFLMVIGAATHGVADSGFGFVIGMVVATHGTGVLGLVTHLCV